MNVAFFLIPKHEVVFLKHDATIRQAMERMEYHRYQAVPLVDDQGRYAGTITEGDLLWKLKNTPDLSFTNAHKTHLTEVTQHMQNASVSVDAQIEDLISQAVEQNFIPVVDDQGVFIGIVRRREIIEYFAGLIFGAKLQVSEAKGV